MRVILHIGQNPAATGYVQHMLGQNWGALIEHGVLYPSVDAEGVAQNLRRLLRPEQTAPAPTGAPHSALAHALWAAQDPASGGARHLIPPAFSGLPSAAEMVKTLTAQRDQLTPETLVLCAPEFALAGQYGTAALAPIQTLLKGCDITLYCSLERPDLHMAAWHQARIDAGEAVDALRETVQREYLDSVHFDYVKLLSPWQEAFPKAQLILRGPQDVAAAGGHVQDFLNQTQLPQPEGFILSEPPQQDLPAPSRAWSDLQRHANRLSADPRALTLFDAAKAAAARKHPLPRDVEIEGFGADLRQEMQDRFVPIHDALCQISRRDSALFADLEDIATPLSIPQHDATRQAFTALQQTRWPRWHPAPLRRLLRKLKHALTS